MTQPGPVAPGQRWLYTHEREPALTLRVVEVFDAGPRWCRERTARCAVEGTEDVRNVAVRHMKPGRLRGYERIPCD